MNVKKLLLTNLPYLLFVYPFDKVSQAFRLAPGADLSAKLLSIGDGFTAAFSGMGLSLHPTDLLIGLAGAVILRLVVYMKGKNAKKYHVDFALKKDTAAEQPRYLVFFKSRDADAITAAFQEFASRRMGREEQSSIRERLAQAKEQAEKKPEHRTVDREKVKVKDRSVQR